MTAAWSRLCFPFIPSVSFWQRSQRSGCSTPLSWTSRDPKSHISSSKHPSCMEKWSGRRSWGVSTHTQCDLYRLHSCEPGAHINSTFAQHIKTQQHVQAQHVCVCAGMPVLYWFSRRMTLWGTISFKLALFINLIIAFFYPYDSGQGTTASTDRSENTTKHTNTVILFLSSSVESVEDWSRWGCGT